MSEKVSRRSSWALAALGIVLAAHFWIWGGAYDLEDIGELRTARSLVAARVDSLGAALDSVRTWADSLQHDPEVIERVARERHAFIRPGEQLFLFVEDVATDESEP
jgi:cell division protein FtsB